MGRCGSESLQRERGGQLPCTLPWRHSLPYKAESTPQGEDPWGKRPSSWSMLATYSPHTAGGTTRPTYSPITSKGAKARVAYTPVGKTGRCQKKAVNGIESSGRMVAFLRRTLCHVPYWPCRTWDGSVMRRTSIPGSRRRRKTSFTSWPADEAAHFNFCEKKTCSLRGKGPCGGAGDMQRPPNQGTRELCARLKGLISHERAMGNAGKWTLC